MPSFFKAPISKQFSSHFGPKVSLRLAYLPDKPAITVLDAYHGPGEIWDEIKKRRPDLDIAVVGIDAKPLRQPCLKGNNIKYLRTLDLAAFDVIDLDAYGCPFAQMQILFERGFPGRVFATYIKLEAGALSHGLLIANGYSHAMIKTCPTLVMQNPLGLLKNYLALNGVARIAYFSFDGARKTYLTYQKGTTQKPTGPQPPQTVFCPKTAPKRKSQQ